MAEPTSSADKNKASQARPTLIKFVILTIAVAMLGLGYYFFREQLSLAELAKHEAVLQQWLENYPWLVFAVAFLLYVTVTGLSIPGATVMSLAYGWFFGFTAGVVLVSFASTSGATLAFLMSRYLFRDAFEHRFGHRLKAFKEALARDGAYYLFTLRLIPAVPFFVINVVMGLTNMRVRTFWWVSQLGMLAGTCVYLYAGSSIPSIDQIVDRSQLRSEDIRNWPALIQQFKTEAEKNPTGPTGQMLASFSDDASLNEAPLDQALLDQALLIIQQHSAEKELSGQEKTTLLLVINHAMQQADFSQSPLQTGDSNNSAELTRRNRAWLETAYPQFIAPPQKILSWKLLSAFALLGIFPLAIKKMMNVLRPQARNQ